METTEDEKKFRVTETVISNTTYVVEFYESDRAKETAYDKIKRLILSAGDIETKQQIRKMKEEAEKGETTQE